jgi:hypothetical protein
MQLMHDSEYSEICWKQMSLSAKLATNFIALIGLQFAIVAHNWTYCLSNLQEKCQQYITART